MARGDQFVRQWELLSILAAWRFGATLEELAKELEVHVRTVRRDVEVLESAGFLMERERDAATRHVKIKLPPHLKAPAIPFTLAEVLGLYFAGNLMAGLRGTPLKEGVDTALRKIERTLPVRAIEQVAHARMALGVRAGAVADYRPHVGTIARAQQAVAERRKLEVLYRAYGRPRADRHVVHPYALSFAEGALYLIGFSEARQAIRVFRVDRVERAALREEKFDVPEEFDAEAWLGEAFGACREDRTHEVRIEFTPREAPWIRERTWHPTQRIEELKWGGVVLSMRVAGLSEVLGWVLSFGAGAKVLGPEELVRKWRDEVRQLSLVAGR